MLQTQGAISAPAGRSMRPSSPDKPQKTDFLVSFLVDARGGSMTGARRSDGLYRVLQNYWSTLKTDIIGKIHCIKHTNIAKCLYILGDFPSGTPGAYY